MRTALVLLVPAFCVGLAASAWADRDRDRHKHRGHGPRGPAVIVQPTRVIVPERDRQTVYRYYRSDFANVGCPPGLVWRGNGCLPPGQARPVQARPVYVGQPVPPAVVHQPAPPVVVKQLEPAPLGNGPVPADDNVMVTDMTNQVVSDIVNDLGLD